MSTNSCGCEAAEALRAQMKARVDALYLEYIFPVLATIRVGEAPAAVQFEAELLDAAKATGVRIRRYIFPADTKTEDLAVLIRQINEDPLLSALVLLQPMPEPGQGEALAALIAPRKAVDRAASAAQPESAQRGAMEAAMVMGRVIDTAEGSAK